MRELPTGNRNVASVRWTADGQGVITTGHGGPGSDRLVYTDLAGHTETVWRKENEWLPRSVPSPDGRYLAYATMIRDSNAWMIENF